MNSAHLHLLFNHAPILGSAFGLLLLVWGMLRRSDSVSRVGLATLVLSALIAIPAYLTGGPAEHLVEDLPGISEASIHTHEQAALIASYALWALGAACAWVLWRYRRTGVSVPSRYTRFALVGAVVVAGLMSWTSLLGGVIRHTEIRGDAVDRAVAARSR
jgi:uncharacterized membrane protein